MQLITEKSFSLSHGGQFGHLTQEHGDNEQTDGQFLVLSSQQLVVEQPPC